MTTIDSLTQNTVQESHHSQPKTEEKQNMQIFGLTPKGYAYREQLRAEIAERRIVQTVWLLFGFAIVMQFLCGVGMLWMMPSATDATTEKEIKMKKAETDTRYNPYILCTLCGRLHLVGEACPCTWSSTMPVISEEMAEYMKVVSNVLDEKDELIAELTKAVETLVYEECAPYCKDENKVCNPDCWVLKYKELLEKVKKGERYAE